MEDEYISDVDEYLFDVVAATELFLAFDAAKSALVQAEERAQLAVASLLSAARPAQDALLRLEALAAECYWGVPISPNAAHFMCLKREAAAREVAVLNGRPSPCRRSRPTPATPSPHRRRTPGSRE
jgi:hypothetical protein